jgi:hypothetical protein
MIFPHMFLLMTIVYMLGNSHMHALCGCCHQYYQYSCILVVCWLLQVEARLRQLEGKTLATEGAKPKVKEQPAKYDKTKQNGSLPSVPKAYNADADVAMPEQPSKKVSRVYRRQHWHSTVIADCWHLAFHRLKCIPPFTHVFCATAPASASPASICDCDMHHAQSLSAGSSVL